MIELLQMNESHVLQIAKLEKMCFSDPWSENSISSELKNPLSLWLVATVENQVVGYIGSQSVQGEADVMNIAVHPEFRRKGIAKILLLGLMDKLKTNGVSSLTLEVRASNTAAIALYQQLEFRQVGCRPGYYRHPKEDAIIMRKEWQI